MNEPTQKRIGTATVWTGSALSCSAVLEIVGAPGERMSISPKSRVDRVGDWVVKRSRPYWGVTPLRLTLARDRYRSAYCANRALAEQGIRVPELGGYVEWGLAGTIWGNALVTHYLAGYRNIREHAVSLGLDGDRARAYLNAIAGQVLRFYEAGAWHGDLADKNMLTLDGYEFAFIDLDSVRLNHRPTILERRRNLVQLLDAFYDLWPWEILTVLTEALLPPGEHPDAWTASAIEELNRRIASRHAFQLLSLRRADLVFGRLDSTRER